MDNSEKLRQGFELLTDVMMSVLDEHRIDFESFSILANNFLMPGAIKDILCHEGPWFIELPCQLCQKKAVFKFSELETVLECIDDLLQYRMAARKAIAFHYKGFTCDHCKSRNKNQESSTPPKNKEEWTDYFISNYLVPGQIWKGNILAAFKILQEHIKLTDEKAVADHIRQMNYLEFLSTMYWKAVAAIVKHKANGKCSRCKSSEKPLHAHHKSYERHGYELQEWEEQLECLCKVHHDAEHEKSKSNGAPEVNDR